MCAVFCCSDFRYALTWSSKHNYIRLFNSKGTLKLFTIRQQDLTVNTVNISVTSILNYNPISRKFTRSTSPINVNFVMQLSTTKEIK